MRQEELISRDALLVDLHSMKRYAELKNEMGAADTLGAVIAIIERQKLAGVINPTQMVIYRGERE